jgi:hypothetical protein
MNSSADFSAGGAKAEGRPQAAFWQARYFAL